jgi:peptidyl-tRNA hydrolase
MSVGKVAAQAAHAMAMSFLDRTVDTWHAPQRTVLIMQARDEGHIKNISAYLEGRDIGSWTVIDEGVNEIDSHVITALATEVVDKELEDIQDTFSSFELYRDSVRLKIEVDK